LIKDKGVFLRVAVKFCGNCNSHIDPGALYTSLKEEREGLIFDFYNDKESFDILLIINSCPIGCATSPPFYGHVVIATSESVDDWPAEKSQLREAIWEALCTRIKQEESNK